MRKSKTIVFFVLRLFIGWHFLYEGLTKLFDPEWSSEAYLRGSYGFLSEFFHMLASGREILSLVDFLNEWGLILVGTGLMLGILTRIASLSGIVLLLLYYFAYPPFGNQVISTFSEGHFWIVNRNILEAVALLIVYYFPAQDYSVGKIKAFFTNRNQESGKTENQQIDVTKRREMIKRLAALPLFGTVMGASILKENGNHHDALSGATVAIKKYNLTDLKGELPKGRIGDMEMSRLVLGCNLMGGGAHSRDLDYVHDLSRLYNTKKKIFETLAICDQAGIDATNMVSRHFPIFNEYKKISGSKMKTICQLHRHAGGEDPYRQLRSLRDAGADTMYIQGANADLLVKHGKLDIIVETLDRIRQEGMPAGVGAHSIEVLIACEEAGIKPDYYYKTMHHDNYWSAHPREFREEFSVDGKRSNDHNKFHDNMFDLFPDRTVEVINKIKVPVFGFKVLAAGAIQPEDGFRYAFENGADFICVGMFDWQVIENVNTAIDVLNSKLERKRNWFA